MRYIFSLTAIFALGLSVLTACSDAATSLTKADAAKTTTVAQTDDHGHDDNAPRITLADAKADFDAGKAIFIDTRAADSFKLEHIKGAINIGLDHDAARYKEIPKDKKIIIYCS